MNSSNKIVISQLLLAIILLFSSCSYFKTKQSETTAPIVQTRATTPFVVREPANYQCEVNIVSYSGEEKNLEKYFIASMNGARYILFPSNIASLVDAEKGRFRIDNDNKTYSRVDSYGGGDEIERFVSNRWLNEQVESRFEKIGEDNEVETYRIERRNGRDSILAYYDKKKQLVVKQEFYSKEGDQEMLLYSFEIVNIREPADAKLFELPAGYNEAK